MMKGRVEDIDMRRAKELASGDLGTQLGKFPLLYASSVLIGPQGRLPIDNSLMRNGTMTFIRIGSQPLGVTCDHVLVAYETELKRDPGTHCWIGKQVVDLTERIWDRNAELDIAVLNMDGLDLATFAVHETIGTVFYANSTWPPPSVMGDEYVAFGGFPGALRTVTSPNELTLGTFGCGACRVHSVSEESFTIFIEEDEMVQTKDAITDLHGINYGGLSGGPVFRIDDSRLVPEFVGIIYEANMGFEGTVIVKARHASIIQIDGRLTSTSGN